jgi:hypothetical protein
MAHQDAEVVAGDVDQVALVDVLPPSEPSSPHAAALQIVGERSFDDLGAASTLPTAERRRLRLA